MRLSDAILMGRHLMKPIPGSYCETTPNGGCALTMAMKAIGASRSHGVFALWLDADKVWPWLQSGFGSHKLKIAKMFDEEVTTGRMTLEQLADYIRSIEPAEEEYIPDPRDEEPWRDTQTRIEQMNSIKGR